MHSIESLKTQLANHDRPGLALDIDDTLSVTGRHWFNAMKDLAGDPGLTYEEAVKTHAGRLQQLPAWKDHKGIDEWVRATLHRGEFYLELDVMERALERVREVHLHLPIHAYITMRPTSVIGQTVQWLKKHGFPDLPVLAQPPEFPLEQRHAWKAQAISQLYPEILGIVDDDPGVIDHLPADYPGTIFFFGRDTHPRQDKRLIPCKNWDIVYEQVKTFRKK